MNKVETIDWEKVAEAQINIEADKGNSPIKIKLLPGDIASIKKRSTLKNGEDYPSPKTLKGKILSLIGERRDLVTDILLTMEDKSTEKLDKLFNPIPDTEETKKLDEVLLTEEELKESENLGLEFVRIVNGLLIAQDRIFDYCIVGAKNDPTMLIKTKEGFQPSGYKDPQNGLELEAVKVSRQMFCGPVFGKMYQRLVAEGKLEETSQGEAITKLS
jgi:hypothetical protein